MMPNKQNRFVIRWLAVIAWLALIFTLSAQPSLPSVPDIWIELQDVAGHFIEYAVLAALLRWAFAGSGVPQASRWAFVLAVLYAISDEFHQSFVPGRHPDIFDVATDAVGALVALWLLRAWAAQAAARVEGP